MNETMNNSVLAGLKFMHEMHLKQLPFTYNACQTFNKKWENKSK